MDVKFNSTVLITDNFDKMKHFYHEVLKQAIEYDFGNCINFKNGLSIWKLKEEYSISQKLGRTFDKLGNKNLEICFESDTFDKILIELEKFDLIYLHETIEESWGQHTIRFYDPDNNLIEIGESITCFVKRLYIEGLTIDEIVQKTSVPIDTVKKMVE